MRNGTNLIEIRDRGFDFFLPFKNLSAQSRKNQTVDTIEQKRKRKKRKIKDETDRNQRKNDLKILRLSLLPF